jgi:hypothetical protein
MACQKCGSAWVTRKGKDMVSCPECCKMQLAKARKQGRLPSSERRSCQRCNAAFVAVGGNALRHAMFCKSCRPVVQKERRARWKADVAAGRRGQSRSQTKRQAANCPMCGKGIKNNQRQYCSRRCFAVARKIGSHAWDRTSQLESVWHRGGRWANAPSKKIVAAMESNFNKFVADMNSFRVIREMQSFMWRALGSKPRCANCGNPIFNDRPVFCSDDCMKTHAVEVPCRSCGCPAIATSGRKSATCEACKRHRERQEQRRAKQKYGRNHRQRARHHGVKYVAFPVRYIYERDWYKCQLCRRQVLQKATFRRRDGKIHPRSPTIDHIVPMCKGGNHEPANCQTACFSCNTKKGAAAGGQLRLVTD